jgi:hypothetical protein
MSANSKPKPKPRPKPRTLPQSGTRSEARARSSSNNVTRSEPRPRSTSASIASLAQKNDILKTENELLKEELKTCIGLKAENDELKSLLEVKNSMKGLNKMVSLVEFEELKKRDEIRTRMLTEDYEQITKALEFTKIDRQNPLHGWILQGKLTDGILYLESILPRVRMMLEGLTPEEFFMISNLEATHGRIPRDDYIVILKKRWNDKLQELSREIIPMPKIEDIPESKIEKLDCRTIIDMASGDKMIRLKPGPF